GRGGGGNICPAGPPLANTPLGAGEHRRTDFKWGRAEGGTTPRHSGRKNPTIGELALSIVRDLACLGQNPSIGTDNGPERDPAAVTEYFDDGSRIQRRQVIPLRTSFFALCPVVHGEDFGIGVAVDLSESLW